jgi:hypothetical protein
MSLPIHHATRTGGEKPVYVCAECLVRWPCLAAHRAAAIRCSVCGRLWSEHPAVESRFGCSQTRRLPGA